MKNDTIIKLALGALVLFLVLPVLPKVVSSLKPNPPSFERFENALRAAGMSVDSVSPIEPPQLEAVATVAMWVNGTTVFVYKYNSEGKIAKQLAYQSPDSGSVAVEAMGIAQSLGARNRKPPTVLATRNGMFMLVIVGEDKALNTRIAGIFERL